MTKPGILVGKNDAHRKDVLGDEAGVDRGETDKTLDEQSGTREQQECQCHLRHDQGSLCATATLSPDRPATALL